VPRHILLSLIAAAGVVAYGAAESVAAARAAEPAMPAVSFSLPAAPITVGSAAWATVAGTTTGGSTASDGATVIVAQSDQAVPCDRTILDSASPATILTEAEVEPGNFSVRTNLNTDRPGSSQLCALLWNGLSPPDGPILAAATVALAVLAPPPPPSHPSVSALDTFGNFDRPGSRVTLVYDAANNAPAVNAATGDGDSQREVVTVIGGGRTITKTLTAWHKTPIRVDFRFVTLVHYVGAYRWCVQGVGRDGGRSSVRCASFSMHRLTPPPRSSGVGGAAGGSSASTCLVGNVGLATVGVACATARQVYEDLVYRAPLPPGWLCSSHRCEGPPDFTGLRVSFTW
jgi:hypothetical protein